ncbi:MAG: efflux RND transporter periplasmic adaptor subunit [Bryobacteraceae bacterium]
MNLHTTHSPQVEPGVDRAVYAPRTRVRPLLTFFAVLLALVISAVVVGVLPRLRRERGLQATADLAHEQLPIVNVAVARRAPVSTPLELPGDLQAMIEAPIFARADGYLTKRYVDIGDRVRKGQPLAEIETPELDQQIQQARATVSNAQSSLKEAEADLTLADAKLKLSQKTKERWRQLEGKGVLSHQEADEKGADAEVRTAQVEVARAKIKSAGDLVAANEASLRRVLQMKSFARVTAPFDGMITARNVDVGTLINSGNGGASREMFRIADVRIMRIFVNLPQAYVGAIRIGEKAGLRVQELPGQVFSANIDRFTNEVDTASRSMLAILTVPNPRGILMPGMYAQVTFAANRPNDGVLIPGDAMVLGTQGARVAVAGPGNRVHFRTVKVGNDYGSEVEILNGLQPGDLVVINPGDTVRDNALVEVHK